MQNHNDDTIKTSGHSSLKKIYLSLYLKGFERVTKGFTVRVELETERNCNILTPTLMAITAFLSRSPGLFKRGPGGPASLGYGPHSSIFSPTGLNSNWLNRVSLGPPLLGAGFLYRILTLTDWTSCAPSYIIVRCPPSSCGRQKLHSFNPSTVKVIFWYSSTGCTCYLNRCISYFDSLAWSEVNIQHTSSQDDWRYASA